MPDYRKISFRGLCTGMKEARSSREWNRHSPDFWLSAVGSMERLGGRGQGEVVRSGEYGGGRKSRTLISEFCEEVGRRPHELFEHLPHH